MDSILLLKTHNRTCNHEREDCRLRWHNLTLDRLMMILLRL